MHYILFLFLLFITPAIAQSACTNPAGVEGKQVYNTTYKTMQFCDGTNWIAMKGGGNNQNHKKICTGKTTPGVGWAQYGSTLDAYINVDTSICGFTTTPIYTTSISGDGSHWSAIGESAIYNQTATSFRIYIRRHDDDHTWNVKTSAENKNWYINWIAMEEGVSPSP